MAKGWRFRSGQPGKFDFISDFCSRHYSFGVTQSAQSLTECGFLTARDIEDVTRSF